MELRELIAEVLELQASYASANTPEMQRRGLLVRRDIPGVVHGHRAALAQAIGISEGDLIVEGRDGTGLKSEVPWVRFASRSASPSATTGWYVVLLHRRDGAGAYLTLAHGSTQFHDGALVARSDAELASLVLWARGLLAGNTGRDAPLRQVVRLGTRAPLAVAYEKSCAAAFYYAADSLPSDDAFLADMVRLAGMLGRLYRSERLVAPLTDGPEVRDATITAAEIARPMGGRSGQGFALTAAERRAVEKRAMALATEALMSLGYGIKDVSASEPFDLEAVRDPGETVSVEVKGTTGGLGAILLTRNEVELHRRVYPANALAVVHGIQLSERSGGEPVALGGELKIWMPWLLEDSNLKGITYSYTLDRIDGEGAG